MTPSFRRAVVIASCVVAPLVLALAVLGGIGSFGTISRIAHPWFGDRSWIVPIGIDLGILALLAWDLLMEFTGMAWPVLRWVAWSFIGATVVLNIAAAHGDPYAAIMHAAMPMLFITVIEGVRHLIRRWVGLTTNTRRDRIPLSRWALAPLSSWIMWRRMVLWNVAAYPDGLQLQYLYLLAVSRLKQQYGRWRWRWKAPLAERVALHLQLAQMALPGELRLPESPGATSDRDEALIQAAQDILAEANQQGVRLSQMDLAARLRARGHRIANERLRWLASQVGLRSARDPA